MYSLSSKYNLDSTVVFKKPENAATETAFGWNEVQSLEANSYPHVALGGTFDYLHTAHKQLMSEALFLASEKLTIGLATDELLKDKELKCLMQNYETRLKAIQEFLENSGKDIEIDIQPINDPCGPTAHDMGSFDKILQYCI